MNVNLVHLHLLLNHFPTIGTIIGLGLLLLAIAKKSEDLTRASFAVFFAIALMSLPTYMTGYPAQKALESLPGVSSATIDTHQSAALLALMFMAITGVVAWFGLWQARRPSPGARWYAPAVLLLAIVTVALMASAANIGGEIRHPEILSGGQPAATAGAIAPQSLTSASIAKFQFTYPWAWPALEVLHFIGLCLLFGIVLIGNLRILGLMKDAPYIDIHKLLPWGMGGFAINAVTGTMFFIGQAFQYIDNAAFHWKVIFMLLAGANVLYLTLFDEVWALGPGVEAPMTAKLVAASQVCLWVGVIYFGRMLPYLGDAF
jgi:uncharacterized membrane protein